MFNVCRVRLSKRRKVGGTTGAPTTNSRLIVKHRQLNDHEIAAQVSIKFNFMCLEKPIYLLADLKEISQWDWY